MMRAAANAAISEENRWPSVSTNGEDWEASNPKARVITAGSTPGQQRVRAYLVVVRWVAATQDAGCSDPGQLRLEECPSSTSTNPEDEGRL